jgi:hypothetical protein
MHLGQPRMQPRAPVSTASDYVRPPLTVAVVIQSVGTPLVLCHELALRPPSSCRAPAAAGRGARSDDACDACALQEWSAIQTECLPHLAPKRVWNKGNYLVRRSSVADIRSALLLHNSGVPGSGSVGEQYVLGVLAAGERDLDSMLWGTPATGAVPGGEPQHHLAAVLRYRVQVVGVVALLQYCGTGCRVQVLGW